MAGAPRERVLASGAEQAFAAQRLCGRIDAQRRHRGGRRGCSAGGLGGRRRRERGRRRQPRQRALPAAPAAAWCATFFAYPCTFNEPIAVFVS